MDIKQTSGVSQALNGLSTPPPIRHEAPQAPTASAPVAPNNGVRPTAAEAAKSVAPDDAEVTRSIAAINRFLQPATTGDIRFSKDEDNGRTLIKIIDTKTNTVLRQIPSEEVVAIAKELDKLQGLLVRDTV